MLLGFWSIPRTSGSAPCHAEVTRAVADADGYCRQRTNSAASTITKSASELRAPEEIRTPNLLIRSQMLYPLSYGRMSLSCVADESASAEARGFEPPVAFEGDNSLAVSPIRPLWHAS